MKINESGLKDLFRAQFTENSSRSRKDCPSPEELLAWVRAAALKKQNKDVLSHINHCPYCIKEIKFLLESLAHEERIIEDIQKLINSDDIKRGKFKFRLSFPRSFWKYATVVTSVFLIIFSITVLDVFKKQKYRHDKTIKIKLIEPVNENIKKPDIVFKWENKINAEFFILELFNESLIPLWKSDKIKETYLKLPDEMTKGLNKEEVYFWMISAYSPEGRKTESRLEKFIVEY